MKSGRLFTMVLNGSTQLRRNNRWAAQVALLL